MALNPKQMIFVQEYLVDKNATRAAKAAGYSGKTAQEQGSRLLSNVMVAAAIKAGLEKQCDRLEISADRVLKEISRIAFLDLSKAYNQHGHLMDITEMDEDTRRAIVGIDVFDEFEGAGRDREKVGEIRKVKTADKVKALELLGKHFKLFTDITEISGKDGGPQVILMMPANGSEAAKTKKKE